MVSLFFYHHHHHHDVTVLNTCHTGTLIYYWLSGTPHQTLACIQYSDVGSSWSQFGIDLQSNPELPSSFRSSGAKTASAASNGSHSRHQRLLRGTRQAGPAMGLHKSMLAILLASGMLCRGLGGGHRGQSRSRVAAATCSLMCLHCCKREGEQPTRLPLHSKCSEMEHSMVWGHGWGGAGGRKPALGVASIELARAEPQLGPPLENPCVGPPAPSSTFLPTLPHPKEYSVSGGHTYYQATPALGLPGTWVEHLLALPQYRH